MNIREFESLSHSGADWTGAFERAAQSAKESGGGVITVPAGVYYTHGIQLYSGTTLFVEAGARIAFLDDEERRKVIDSEFEGIPEKAYMPCVYAKGAENVHIKGDGTLDGQGEKWWQRHLKGENKFARPYLICFDECKNVSVEGVTLTNSPVWTIHPLRCDGVCIRAVTIKNPSNSPNTDGIDPNASRNVRISDTTIDVGDDCIAIKSGTESTPVKSPCENIIITNCHMLHGHGGVVIGSEMSGGVRNVLVSDCIFSETDRGIRLKTRRARGGAEENLMFRDILMDGVISPVVFNMFYFCGKDGKLKRVWDKAEYPVDETTPSVHDVTISGITAKRCRSCAGFFYGLPESPIERVTLKEINIEMARGAEPERPAMMDDCPALAGAGFYLRNARDVLLTDVQLGGLSGEMFDADKSVTFREA